MGFFKLFGSKKSPPKAAAAPTGEKYEGDLLNGKFHGCGRLTMADGSVYEGDFRNGLFHGVGTIYSPNGNIFRGKFRCGRRQGRGYDYVVAGRGCTSYGGNYR